MCLWLALPLLSPSLAHIQQSLCVVLSVFSTHIQHCNAILFVHSIQSVIINELKKEISTAELNSITWTRQYASVSINESGWQPSCIVYISNTTTTPFKYIFLSEIRSNLIFIVTFYKQINETQILLLSFALS